jgi:glycosyltransferase involved in cell wall biosynthesis
MSAPLISAIICTHNPRADYLNRVLAALEDQTLPRHQWELIIVDSGSTPEIRHRTDLTLSADLRLIRVNEPGLAAARKAGAEAANSPLLASVDDDTVFFTDYLATALQFLNDHPRVVCVGGKFLPEYESQAPPWLDEFLTAIAVRDLGPKVIVIPALAPGEKLAEFPASAPIGVNISRRTAYDQYLQRWKQEGGHATLGRTGKSLVSGEDNDFSLCCLEAGGELAYLPALQSRHLIPAFRLNPAYLGKLNRASNRSWIRVLAMHGMQPWPRITAWTVRLRQIRAYFRLRAWQGPANYIRWQGACGQFEGRAEL